MDNLLPNICFVQCDWAWAPIITLAIIDTLLARKFEMRFIGWDRFWLIVVVPAMVTAYYRFSGRREHVADDGFYTATWDVVYYTIMWITLWTFGCMLTYIAVRIDRPLRDALFVHYDALLQFDWRRWTGFVFSHQQIELLLRITYDSILPQTLGSVIYFAHTRRPDRNDELIRTTMIATVIGAAISGLLPASGPHLNGQYFAWWKTFSAIRQNPVAVVSLDHLEGIIVFPSFHSVAAVLLVYSHRPPVRSFPPVLALNLLMLASIPSEGQHYLVDVVSGAIVAIISIAVVRLISARSQS